MRRAGLAWIFLLGASVSARADGFVEAVVGVGFPLGADSYTERVAANVTIGVRAGTDSGKAQDGEFGLDYYRAVLEDRDDGLERSSSGVRITLGRRFLSRIGDDGFTYGRLAFGVDLEHRVERGELAGVGIDRDELGFGFAAEAGFGGGVRFGDFTVGGQLSMPFALHVGDDDPDDPKDFDLEELAYDVTLLGTVGAVF